MAFPKTEKTIGWYGSFGGLNEAVTSGLEYAFVSKDGQQCHKFVHCKDFLHDAVRSSVLGQDANFNNAEIYNFRYDPKVDPPLHTDKTRMVIANSNDSEFYEKIPNCLDFLHQIETQLKIAKTCMTRCAKPPSRYKRGGVWHLVGSRRWITSPPMLSLYALFLRVGMGHKISESFHSTINNIVDGSQKAYMIGDKGRLKGGKIGIDRLFAVGDRKVFPRNIVSNYPNVDISIFHNYFGIVGFSSGSTDNHCPKWHRE